jgi:hypothetical protein
VYENRALSGIFGTKKKEMARGWRRLHNEELHKLYASLNIIKVIKSRVMMGRVACIGKMRYAYKIVVKKPEGKRPLGRPRGRWEY